VALRIERTVKPATQRKRDERERMRQAKRSPKDGEGKGREGGEQTVSTRALSGRWLSEA